MEFFLILIIIICIFSEGFFSGSETAIVSCNKIKIKYKALQGDKSAQVIEKLFEHPEKLLSTTLVGTNLSVVISSSTAAVLFTRITHNPEFGALLGTLILTPVIWIFAEIIPKSIARQYADRISMTSAMVLSRFFYYLFIPLVFPLMKTVGGILNTVRTKKESKRSKEEKKKFITSEELQFLFSDFIYSSNTSSDNKENASQSKISKDIYSREMVHRMFSFSETNVRSVMIPRNEIIGIDINSKVSDVIDKLERYGHSNLLVYDRLVDNFIGIVNIRNLLDVSPQTPIKDFIQDPYIVPETKSIEQLLKEFQNRESHIAVVVDEYGMLAGMVSMEDILEVIVGRIDEINVADFTNPIDKLIEFNGIYWNIDGKSKIEDVNRKLGINIPKKNYKTIAGFITSIMGRIPSKNDSIEYCGMRFTITETENVGKKSKGIKKVMVEKL